MTHTPTPWYALQDTVRVHICVDEARTGESVIATVHNDCDETDYGAPYHGVERAANAAFIVRACNAHDELVAALERVTQQLTDLHAAIVDQGLQTRFVDDSINMLSEAETAINNANTALDAARGNK